MCQNWKEIFKYWTLFQLHSPGVRCDEWPYRCTKLYSLSNYLVNGSILITHSRLSYNKQILKCFPDIKNASENFVIKKCNKWVTSKNEKYPRRKKTAIMKNLSEMNILFFQWPDVFLQSLNQKLEKNQVSIAEFWVLSSYVSSLAFAKSS